MGFIKSITERLATGQKPPAIRYADFSAPAPEDLLPHLDQSGIDEASLTPDQKQWRRDGVLILRDFIPDEITAPYIKRREAHPNPAGWPQGNSYQFVPEMRELALYPPLMQKLEHLIGEQMMLQLCLTNWVTSQRAWHQDDYLNPSFVNCWYVAVWIALADIEPDCGPFEYIPGSHRWPLMRGEKVRGILGDLGHEVHELHWPKTSECFTTPAVEYEMKLRRVKPEAFLAKRGDVLVWHARLMHQGSLAKTHGKERRSLIAHYSGVNHRPDIPDQSRFQDENGQIYIKFGDPTA
ncbi:MAG: phytanoyl-CoA dioxygenase family protein [Rhodospirillales bacterium]|nr:phytanoyl-CoA dioxygenase family protein [Rhodospirillales bacterium]